MISFFRYLLLLVLLLAIPEAFSDQFTKYHVRIANDLGEGLILTLHCKSKDDDLGIKQIPYGYYYEWSFRLDYFGTTLFSCFMSWRDASGTYDIFVAERDQYRCHECWWVVKQEGIYYVNREAGRYEFWWGWQKPPMKLPGKQQLP